MTIAFGEADGEDDLVDLLVPVIRRLNGAKQARILTDSDGIACMIIATTDDN